MDERLRFTGRLLDGEDMSSVCREFGISRKTGYKIWNRYKDHGLEALTDRSRRPVRYANQLPPQVETMIVRCRKEKPHWGARKIREMLVKRLPQDVRVPANSTIHAVLDRNGLVKPARKRRRHKREGTPLSPGLNPNDLWCTDYKGEFRLGNKKYCYPLTVTDHASRYVLAHRPIARAMVAGGMGPGRVPTEANVELAYLLLRHYRRRPPPPLLTDGEWARIRAPLTLIGSDGEIYTDPAAVAERVRAHQPNADVRRLRGVGHDINKEEPEIVNRAILAKTGA